MEKDTTKSTKEWLESLNVDQDTMDKISKELHPQRDIIYSLEKYIKDPKNILLKDILNDDRKIYEYISALAMIDENIIRRFNVYILYTILNSIPKRFKNEIFIYTPSFVHVKNFVLDCFDYLDYIDKINKSEKPNYKKIDESKETEKLKKSIKEIRNIMSRQRKYFINIEREYVNIGIGKDLTFFEKIKSIFKTKYTKKQEIKLLNHVTDMCDEIALLKGIILAMENINSTSKTFEPMLRYVHIYGTHCHNCIHSIGIYLNQNTQLSCLKKFLKIEYGDPTYVSENLPPIEIGKSAFWKGIENGDI